LSGRKTNLAGIDLTPAAAAAIGLAGKGKVDWQFANMANEKTAAASTPNDVLVGLLTRLLTASRTTSSLIPSTGVSSMSVSTNDLVTLLQQILNALQTGQPQTAQPGSTATSPPSQPVSPDQFQKILQMMLAFAGTGQKPELGPVNGALGQGLGNLLDGKKTAIGIFGSLATWLLSSFAPAVPAGAAAAGAGGAAAAGAGAVAGTTAAASGVLPTIAAALGGASGLTGVGLPIFLALTAWGVLGKMEKWSGRSPGAGPAVPVNSPPP
jgi:hypothetical protein